MSKPKISESDLCRAAKRLRTSTAEIEAVAEVESRGEGFYADGFPVILFERHKFRKYTEGKFNKSHPHLSGPAGGYGKAGQNQVNKFNEAFKLDPIAAMKSCSWGKFQIMGFNYAMCGFDSVGEFVEAMKESEGRQLDAFVSFIISAGLADELRAHKWEALAEGYNGPDYKKNRYHIKLHAAFAKFSKRKIHCGEDSTVAPASNPPQQIVNHEKAGESTSVERPLDADFTEGERPGTNVQIDNAENVDIKPTPPLPQGKPVQVTVERVSIFAKVGAGIAAITGIGINFGNLVTTRLNDMTLPQLGYVLGGVAIIGIALFLYDRAAKRAHEKTLAKMVTASDPAQNTVELREQTTVKR